MQDEDNNSSETGVPLIFKSRDELIRWARQVRRRNGFVIVVQKSDGGGIRDRKPRLCLACERSGSYRNTQKNSRPRKKKARLIGTKKCECPFLLKGKKLATNDDWILIVVCGVHNHPAAEYFEGHSYAGRLSHEETSLLVDMSKSMVRPSEILVILKQRDDANASTMKTIYNACHRYKVAEKAGRSQMQQLLGQLAVNKYIEWHRSCVDTEIVIDLFFAHPTSLNLLHAFPKVFLMDCTYKTNRYRFPLLEIVGVTSIDMTFSVAFAYLQYEKEDNYTWALGLLRSVMDENTFPSVIVTDR
ncbi:protein FAR-RED ELONGATED HYPOCOTYL 3-like [Camellia sinensis]|uniref:protein FAR-RED ELONGATED HYPOCOTYL 3-like n=1 Tax=Camellia sinensis TaxID=4442 RepID=UPI001036A3E0|nr:protein FAR-RED ELONGATED HYPOCOTYL 3-like [Camellia sinensis]